MSYTITTHTRKGMETAKASISCVAIVITTHTRKGMETIGEYYISDKKYYNSHPQGDGNI